MAVRAVVADQGVGSGKDLRARPAVLVAASVLLLARGCNTVIRLAGDGLGLLDPAGGAGLVDGVEPHGRHLPSPLIEGVRVVVDIGLRNILAVVHLGEDDVPPLGNELFREHAIVPVDQVNVLWGHVVRDEGGERDDGVRDHGEDGLHQAPQSHVGGGGGLIRVVLHRVVGSGVEEDHVRLIPWDAIRSPQGNLRNPVS